MTHEEVSERTDCMICHRRLVSVSPMHQGEPVTVTLDDGRSATLDDGSATLDDGRSAHESCKRRWDFLKTIEDDTHESSIVTDWRLKGYRRGLPFDFYMNWPFGLEDSSVSSYRVLQTAQSSISFFEDRWRMGHIVPRSQFDMSLPDMRIADVTSKEESNLRWYVSMAQIVLSFAVILWYDAHIPKDPRSQKNHHLMFLDWVRHYPDDQWQTEADYFRVKRNRSIAHIDSRDQDVRQQGELGASFAYSPYPKWGDDWKRFKRLLDHSMDTCKTEICHKLGLPIHDGHSLQSPTGTDPIGPSMDNRYRGDPVQPAADFLTVFEGVPFLDLPTAPSGLRERRQYPMEFDGERWIVH